MMKNLFKHTFAATDILQGNSYSVSAKTTYYFIVYLGIDASFSCEAKINYSTYLENTFNDYSIV